MPDTAPWHQTLRRALRLQRWLPSGVLNSPFRRAVGGMMAYTAIGQGFYVLTAPIIGRLYSPEQIGVYGLFFTIAVTLAGFVSMLYDLAIPAARNNRDAIELTWGAAAIAVAFSVVSGAGLALASATGVMGMSRLPVYAGAFLLALLLLQAALQILQGWLIRTQQALTIGKSNVMLNIARGSSQVGLGLGSANWVSMVIGELLGRTLAVSAMLHKRPVPRLVRPRWAKVAGTLRRYREFPAVLLPAQLVEGAALVIQISGLTVLYGTAALGQYFLMRRTLDLPVAFIFRSLSDVFYAKLAELTRSEPHRIRGFFVRAFAVLALCGGISALPLVFYGPEIFALIFGEQWREAGALAAVMVPAAVLNLAVAPVSRVFALTDLPSLRYVPGVVGLIGTGLVILFAWQNGWDLYTATIGLSAAITGSYLAYFAAGYVAAGRIREMPNNDPVEAHT